MYYEATLCHAVFIVVNKDFEPSDSINTELQFTSCDRKKSLTLFITDDQDLENNEPIVITWINLTLTRTAENGSNFEPALSEQERGRLTLSMTNTTVVIVDDDGKSITILFFVTLWESWASMHNYEPVLCTCSLAVTVHLIPLDH